MLEGVGAECRQSASYYELLGIAYELSGKKDRAEESLQRAAGLDPNSIQIKEQLGATLLRNGKGAKAAAVLEAIAAQTPGVGAKKLLLGAYVESEQWQKAGQLLASEPLEHVEPSDPVFSVWWADTLIHTKQSARLNDELKRVAQPLPANLLFSLATLFAKQEMYPEAAKYFSEIPEADADAAVYFNLGLALSHCRRYDEARKNFFLAIDHDPQNTEAYFRVGVDYAASGQARLAVPWLLRMHEMKPERRDVIFALAEQWLNLGYTSSAKQLFAGLSQALRSNPLVECAEADVWRSAGEASKAEGLLPAGARQAEQFDAGAGGAGAGGTGTGQTSGGEGGFGESLINRPGKRRGKCGVRPDGGQRPRVEAGQRVSDSRVGRRSIGRRGGIAVSAK